MDLEEQLFYGHWLYLYYFFKLRYFKDYKISASGAYVGLAPPGEAGSWQRECKVIQGNIKAQSLENYLCFFILRI